jgi:hypothetical protein
MEQQQQQEQQPHKHRGWRVKLYELESLGGWLDRGVGHVTVDLVPQTPSGLLPHCHSSSGSGSGSGNPSLPTVTTHAPALCIVSEETGEFLLQSKIQCDDLYEKQGGECVFSCFFPLSPLSSPPTFLQLKTDLVLSLTHSFSYLESMILWKEADFSATIDYAMSFQQVDGCASILYAFFSLSLFSLSL